MNNPVIPREWLNFLNSSHRVPSNSTRTVDKKQKCIEDGGHACDDCDWNRHGECEGTCFEANESCTNVNNICICR